MHFSIPDTQELYADTTAAATTTYTVYNIYINGNYHCCLRYRELHALHEQLRRLCAYEPSVLGAQLPTFPPKKLLPLTNGQLETRRAALEHYLQLIGQDARIAHLPYFQQFLLRAQIDAALTEHAIEADNACTQLTIVLGGVGGVAGDDVDVNAIGGNYQLQVNCCAKQNASALLQIIGQTLKLSPNLLQYFCLYLVRREQQTLENGMDTENSLVLLRRLMNFESPYISRLHAPVDSCLLLRTSYWNPLCDLRLLRNSVALNLLYLQTVDDVAREWIITAPDVRQKLHCLQQHNLKRDYMEMARQLPLYGCLQFNATAVDYPEITAPEAAIISIGNKELSIRTPRGIKIYETKFRVTRMRCWRVSAMHNTLESRDNPTHLQLSFEYLMSKQSLRWITITSTQAMLMSVCLQAMVDELLNGGGSGGCGDDTQQHQSTPSSSSVSSEQSSACTPSSSSSSASSSTSTSSSASSNSSASTMGGGGGAGYLSYVSNTSPTAPVKFLAQRLAPNSKQQNKLASASTFSAVFFRNDAVQHNNNEAFEGIGDDDL